MRKSLLAITLLCLLAAACGSSSKGYGSTGTTGSTDTGTSSSPAAGAAGSPTVTLTQTNYTFTPSTITGKAGSTITVKLVNKAGTDHNFTIESLKVNKDVAAGTTETVQVKLPAASTIPFFCEYHKAKGMTGQLKVIAT